MTNRSLSFNAVLRVLPALAVLLLISGCGAGARLKEIVSGQPAFVRLGELRSDGAAQDRNVAAARPGESGERSPIDRLLGKPPEYGSGISPDPFVADSSLRDGDAELPASAERVMRTVARTEEDRPSAGDLESDPFSFLRDETRNPIREASVAREQPDSSKPSLPAGEGLSAEELFAEVRREFEAETAAVRRTVEETANRTMEPTTDAFETRISAAEDALADDESIDSMLQEFEDILAKEQQREARRLPASDAVAALSGAALSGAAPGAEIFEPSREADTDDLFAVLQEQSHRARETMRTESSSRASVQDLNSLLAEAAQRDSGLGTTNSSAPRGETGSAWNAADEGAGWNWTAPSGGLPEEHSSVSGFANAQEASNPFLEPAPQEEIDLAGSDPFQLPLPTPVEPQWSGESDPVVGLQLPPPALPADPELDAPTSAPSQLTIPGVRPISSGRIMIEPVPGQEGAPSIAEEGMERPGAAEAAALVEAPPVPPESVSPAGLLGLSGRSWFLLLGTAAVVVLLFGPRRSGRS